MAGYTPYGQPQPVYGYNYGYPPPPTAPGAVPPPPVPGAIPAPIPPGAGRRLLYRCVEWIEASNGTVPVGNPVIAGRDVNGEPIYVGSAHVDGDVIPGKVVPSHGCCYVAFDGRERSHRTYNVLVNNGNLDLHWHHASGGHIPTGALQGGRTCSGEPLYIGRRHHDGSLTVGKIHPSHGRLYIPFGGDEVSYSDYEVLCCKTIPLIC